MKRSTFNGPNTGIICSSCGYEKEMYYRPWCPLCDKPQLQTIQTLNLIQALHHVTALTGEDYHANKAWHWFCDHCDFRNGTYVHWAPYDEELPPTFEKLIEVFNIDREEGVIFHIDW